MAHPRIDRGILIRYQRHQPVLVGDAHPAAGALVLDVAVFLDVLVLVLVQGTVEDAQRAFVQDVVAECRRRAVAGDQAIGNQRHRLADVVADPLRNREQVVLIDGERLFEHQTLAVVPGHGDRAIRRQRLGGCRPLGRRAWNRLVGVGGRHPAELGVIGLAGSGGRQQHDFRAVAIRGHVVIGQRQIVDTCADGRDGAVKARRIDLDPLPGCHDFVAVARSAYRRRRSAWDRNRGGRSGDAFRSGRSGQASLFFRALLRQFRLALFHTRNFVEVLKSEQDDDRQQDRHEEVALVSHGSWSVPAVVASIMDIIVLSMAGIRYRVPTSSAPRIAPQDAPSSKQAATDRAVLR